MEDVVDEREAQCVALWDELADRQSQAPTKMRGRGVCALFAVRCGCGCGCVGQFSDPFRFFELAL